MANRECIKGGGEGEKFSFFSLSLSRVPYLKYFPYAPRYLGVEQGGFAAKRNPISSRWDLPIILLTFVDFFFRYIVYGTKFL